MPCRVYLEHAPIVQDLRAEELHSHQAMRVWATSLLCNKMAGFSREWNVVGEGRAHFLVASSVSEAFLKPTPTSCGKKGKVSFGYHGIYHQLYTSGPSSPSSESLVSCESATRFMVATRRGLTQVHVENRRDSPLRITTNPKSAKTTTTHPR